MVRLERKLKDGRYVFEREAVYFVLTHEDAEQVLKIMKEQEKNDDPTRE